MAALLLYKISNLGNKSLLAQTVVMRKKLFNYFLKNSMGCVLCEDNTSVEVLLNAS